MRIAILAPYWNPPVFVGGISRVIYELRKRWITLGHTVHVYASVASTKECEGIFRLPFPQIPMNGVWNNSYLAVSNKLKVYDVLFPQTAIQCLFLDRRRCVPLIHTLSVVEHRVPWRPWRYLQKAIEKKALSGLRRCLCLSAQASAMLEADYGISDTVVLRIRNGVDTGVFSPDTAQQQEEFIILAAGRFIPRKRFDLLIRAFAALSDKHSQIRLVLAGDGELGDSLRRLTRDLGLEEKVEFPGYLDSDAMVALYRRSSIFALPSVSEGMPMTVLEAQACGLPCVVGNFSTAAEMVREGDTGFIVRDSSVQGWANSIEPLIRNREMYGRLSAEARRFVLREFGWDTVSETLLTAFRAASQNGELRHQRNN